MIVCLFMSLSDYDLLSKGNASLAISPLYLTRSLFFLLRSVFVAQPFTGRTKLVFARQRGRQRRQRERGRDRTRREHNRDRQSSSAVQYNSHRHSVLLLSLVLNASMSYFLRGLTLLTCPLLWILTHSLTPTHPPSHFTAPTSLLSMFLLLASSTAQRCEHSWPGYHSPTALPTPLRVSTPPHKHFGMRQ